MGNIPIDEQYQMIGLGVLIGVGAIIIGYIVRLVVPDKHFPWTAGLLTSNAVIAACAYAGVKTAGMILVWWLVMSMVVGAYTFITDLDLREKAGT